MHFKFTADLGRKIEYALATGGYNQGSRSYRLYATLIERMRARDGGLPRRGLAALPEPARLRRGRDRPMKPSRPDPRPHPDRVAGARDHRLFHAQSPFRTRPDGLALGLPLAGPAAALVAPGPGIQPEIRRFGRHYIVNGWVLTARDLELLGLDAG